MQETKHDGADEFYPRDLQNHLEAFLPRIRALADVLCSGEQNYADGTLFHLGRTMLEAIDEAETFAIECETARLKAQKQQREAAGAADHAAAAMSVTEASADAPSDPAEPDYICPRWWNINPGDLVTDSIYSDAAEEFFNRIDGIGWLMLSTVSDDSDEAKSVAGILVDMAQEAKALHELWLSGSTQKPNEGARGDAAELIS
tara:strand:+ start:12695 stop:13300 length:606 start_codon:yes stop_codon:yes gene_type:complete